MSPRTEHRLHAACFGFAALSALFAFLVTRLVWVGFAGGVAGALCLSHWLDARHAPTAGPSRRLESGRRPRDRAWRQALAALAWLGAAAFAWGHFEWDPYSWSFYAPLYAAVFGSIMAFAAAQRVVAALREGA